MRTEKKLLDQARPLLTLEKICYSDKDGDLITGLEVTDQNVNAVAIYYLFQKFRGSEKEGCLRIAESMETFLDWKDLTKTKTQFFVWGFCRHSGKDNSFILQKLPQSDL